jgi:dihydropteroate synthase
MTALSPPVVQPRPALAASGRWSLRSGEPSWPLVMGIVNVTPDSFHDGGRHAGCDDAIAHAITLIEHGADIIDVGGESTRPGAQAASLQEELDRVLPVIEAIAGIENVMVSVDTSRVGVMRAAVKAGATLINDVRALRGDGHAVGTAAQLKVPVCVMHMLGEPGFMQNDPYYDDVCAEVSRFLLERARTCVDAGIEPRHILIDPGIGFGKRLPHNLSLLAGLSDLVAHGFPVLVGASRKSMLGEILDQPTERRLYGSLVIATHAAAAGAAVLRVHDVEPTVEVLKVWQALRTA